MWVIRVGGLAGLSLAGAQVRVSIADAKFMVLVQQRNGDDATVIALSGDLDSASAGQLRAAAARASYSDRPVLIEMSAVTQFPAPVLGALVGAWHTLSDRVTVRCSPPVFAALAEVGLDRLLPIG